MQGRCDEVQVGYKRAYKDEMGHKRVQEVQGDMMRCKGHKGIQRRPRRVEGCKRCNQVQWGANECTRGG